MFGADGTVAGLGAIVLVLQLQPSLFGLLVTRLTYALLPSPPSPTSSLPSSLSETAALGSSPPPKYEESALSKSTSGALPLVKGAASINDESRASKKATGSLSQADQGRGAAVAAVNSRVALISSAARKAENADRQTSAQRIKRLLSIQRLLQAERLGQQMTNAEDAARAQSSVGGPVAAPALLPQPPRGQLGLPPPTQAARESQPSRTSTPRSRWG